MQPDGETRYGKRVLVELSHAIERFALAAPPGSPLVVIAMFQKLSYFEREIEVYRDIAARGAVTLVGLVEEVPPELPPGVRHTLLLPTDSLAREWSVTVLGPRGGATLVATDLETVDGSGRTLEEGRQFVGHWSFRRADAYREVLRLRSRLRLPEDTVTEIDAVLRAVLDEPEPTHQDWWAVPLRFIVERMDAAIHGQATPAPEVGQDDSSERDPRTGLYTEAFLSRWTAGLGVGTLPIGLVLLRVFGVDELRARYGQRAELAALQCLTNSVQGLLTDADRLIRIGREDFLVVLPSSKAEDVLRLRDDICARVGELDQMYPFVAMPAAAAAMVTRERPLPLNRLVHQVENGAGPVDALV